MTDDAECTPEQGRQLWLSIMYNGPWERLSTRLLAIDPRTVEIKHEIKEGGIRDRLAAWCERRDHAWRKRHVARNRVPAARWERRR